MEFNLADLFENAVDHFGDREYLVANGKRRTYAEMEERANRLAHHLAAQGVGRGDHVGIYAYNSVEWVEILWAGLPHYINATPNPRGALALVQKLTAFLGIKLDEEPLRREAAAFEQRISNLVAGDPELCEYVRQLKRREFAQ